MVIAGFWFTIGAIINCAAQDLVMLYVGRVLLGFGVGFANQSVSNQCALQCTLVALLEQFQQWSLRAHLCSPCDACVHGLQQQGLQEHIMNSLHISHPVC